MDGIAPAMLKMPPPLNARRLFTLIDRIPLTRRASQSFMSHSAISVPFEKSSLSSKPKPPQVHAYLWGTDSSLCQAVNSHS